MPGSYKGGSGKPGVLHKSTAKKNTVATVKLLNLGCFCTVNHALHSIQIHSYEEHGIILFIFYWVILETSTPRHFHTENLELHYLPLDALMHFRIYQISHLSPLDSRNAWKL